MWVFDFEVFKKDWLVVIEHLITGEIFEFINDYEGLQKFYKDHNEELWIGFNNKRYDDYIFKVILLGQHPKRANDIIIEENNILKLYHMYDINKKKLYSMDISQDGLFFSLKEIEAFMGLDIRESDVDFRIDRELTAREIYSTLKYCRHDVHATKELIKSRVKNLKLKMDLVKTFNLDKSDLKRTNGQLTAKILRTPTVKDYGDELTPFELPPNIWLENQEIIDFYCNSGDLDYSKKLVIDIEGVEHTLAYGGLHGALQNFEYEGEIWMLDVSSYYPSLMIFFDYLSRTVPKQMRKLFREIYELRLKLKAEGKKDEAEIYKLVLNTVYGAMKDQYNGLYDPKMANNVCIAGQLALIDLIEKVGPYCTLVQSNTDGIAIIPHDKEKIMEEVKKWEKRTNLPMGLDKAKAIYQKDVNNYILVEEDDSLKLKGGMVYQHDPKVIRKSNKILGDCVVNYFVHKMTPEETIQNDDDLMNYQIVTKSGRTFDRTVWKYDEQDRSALRINRVFATKDTRAGKLYKLKTTEHGLSYNSIASLPDHCELSNDNTFDINNLDKSWYVEQAWKRIRKFKGEG